MVLNQGKRITHPCLLLSLSSWTKNQKLYIDKNINFLQIQSFLEKDLATESEMSVICYFIIGIKSKVYLKCRDKCGSICFIDFFDSTQTVSYLQQLNSMNIITRW